jgi:hypothetical protein
MKLKNTGLSGMSFLILITAASVAWAARARTNTANYTPPAEPGQIFTVIDYPRAQGRAQTASVNSAVGDASRSIIVNGPAYQNPCTTSTPAGFVLRLRHNTPDSPPVTVSTNGTIIRGPYQGDPPPELLHACYKLVK